MSVAELDHEAEGRRVSGGGGDRESCWRFAATTWRWWWRCWSEWRSSGQRCARSSVPWTGLFARRVGWLGGISPPGSHRSGEPAAGLEVQLAAELIERAKEQGVSLVGPDGLLAGITKT